MSGEEIIKFARELVESLQGEQISPDNIMRVIVRGMILVEKIKNMSGIQRKSLLMSSVKHIISVQISQPEIKDTMILILETVGSRAIDNLVAAAKGDYNFGESSVFKKIFCCC